MNRAALNRPVAITLAGVGVGICPATSSRQQPEGPPTPASTTACRPPSAVGVTGLSSAPIPWPIGQTLPKGNARAFVLYADLVEAVKKESAAAVMYWFGVKGNTVWQWRKALGGGQYTEGTRERKSEAFLPHVARVVEAARPT